MLIPIRTDSPIRRTPYVNYALLTVNVLVYVLGSISPAFSNFETRHLVLDGAWPRLHQFFTYQFLHSKDSILHLAGNMWFLWIFGNSVNGKMGHLPYLLLYLAGGVCAGAGFTAGNALPLIGASGSIAAVTTAYLVLFPASNIQIFYWFFFFGVFELPSMIMIVAKIILWDNIIGPSLAHSGSAVAYSAHLAGYVFGFSASLFLLVIRAIPRDQFDMLAMLRRWRQRRAFAATMRDPAIRARARYGRVAHTEPARTVVEARPIEDPVRKASLARVASMRAEIGRSLNLNDRTHAADLYEQLLLEDPDQVLPCHAQLDVANQLYTLHRIPQAAAAYERFLKTYPTSPEAQHVRLLLGIVYARDLKRYDAAERYLRDSMEKLSDSRRREQCAHWLDVVLSALGRPAPEN
jgi:membrane associated rhomboid family serine protease